MTRWHRRTHLLMWIVLGPLMLVALVVAISIRPVAARTAGVPSATGGTR